MKSISIALLAFTVMIAGWSLRNASAAPPGYFKDQKVVYHNDGGGPDNASYFRRMLNSIKIMWRQWARIMSRSASSITVAVSTFSRWPKPTRNWPPVSMLCVLKVFVF